VFTAPQGWTAAVQAQLGHSSIQVTMDRYGHLFPDVLEQLADRLDAARAAARTDPARTEPQTDAERGDFSDQPPL
jgi:hypothetical protein